MKTKEELNALKAEFETVSRKLAELTEEELDQVVGGFKVEAEDDSSWLRTILDFFFKNRK